ncbi:MAG: methyltransferase domain-containing protein [SAR324 cluster bacterium]|nr:methyltransferase domain-containing protein [SAR324 cluster bacterium]
MSVNPARFWCVKNLLNLQKQGWLPEELPPSIPKSEDRRLYSALFQGILRNSILLDTEITARLSQPLHKLPDVVRIILQLGTFELLFMEKIPERATLFEAVELAGVFKVPHKKNLVNAVLRNLQRDLAAGKIALETHPLEVRTSHPAWMVERWRQFYGPELAESMCVANNQYEGMTFFSKNSLENKNNSDVFPDDSMPHPLVPEGRILTQGSSLLQGEAFQHGPWFVQDVSSWLFMRLIHSVVSGKILDMCAAPGGKTFHLLENPAAVQVVSVDSAHARMRLLAENLTRLSFKMPLLLTADGHNLPFTDQTFDLVLVDAPCSSTGTIRKNPDIKRVAKLQDLLRQVSVQRKLLESGAAVTKINGFLVYSTCSLEPEENQRQISRFLQQHPAFQVVPPGKLLEDQTPYQAWLTEEGFFQTLPEAGIMGFFGALLQRVS